MSAVPRRIVTGHDDAGRSVFTSDGPVPAVWGPPGTSQFVEIYATTAAPAPIAATEPEPTDAPLIVAPPPQGTVFRINVMAPGMVATMHRTESVDFAMVLEGEVVLVLDEGETVMRPGDTVVQRGTSHGWENRGDVTCRMLFVLVDGEFTGELRDSFKDSPVPTLPRDPFPLEREPAADAAG
jgi:quercetin dioxygenase-like cupin family protein